MAVYKKYVRKLLCWILLLQLVNISIDPPEIHPSGKVKLTAKAQQDINKIESLYEMVSEGLLDNDIPEGDEPEIEKTAKSFQLYYNRPSVQDFSIGKAPMQFQVYLPGRHTSQYIDPISPPPKYS